MRSQNLYVKHKSGQGAPTKPPTINIGNLRKSIHKKQERELYLKGALNSDLYIYALDNQDKIINYGPWLNQSASFLKSFINSTTYIDNISRVIISNQYFDWRIEVYNKV